MSKPELKRVGKADSLRPLATHFIHKNGELMIMKPIPGHRTQIVTLTPQEIERLRNEIS